MAGFRQWLRDVSVDVTGGLILAGILAIGALAVSLFRPLKTWFFGAVFLYGWALLLSLTAAFFVGYLLAVRLLRKNRHDTCWHQEASPESFKPSGLEDRAIRLMRFADGRWLSFDGMVQNLDVHSRQDLGVALTRLADEGWIEGDRDNYIMEEGGRSYRLAVKGITYAGQRGYKTLTEVQRENANKVDTESTGS